MARSKVYIIDEVHMLSKQAFNGLLKTLEEPPDHVKFLFATTEIDKVPVTVRSRCQRFDLRRVEAGMLIGHLSAICAQEGVTIEPEALRLIAGAAEGSVRDALSLLDQAIAQGSGATPSRVTVTAEALRELLGLADHGRIIDLFEALMGGGMASALNLLKELYDCGADPAEVLASLADFIHLVTRLKLVPEAGQDNVLTPDERQRGSQFAASLSMPVLTRAWQLLLKGLREVKESPRPLAAADMVLVRIGYAADLPTPDEALRKLAARTGGEVPERSMPGKNPPGSGSVIRASSAAALAAAPRESIPAAPPVRLSRFEDVVALAGEHRDIQMKLALERDVRLVRFEPGQIEFSLKAGASPQLAQTLTRRLLDWTGNRWMVVVSSTEGYPSLKEQEEARVRETFSGVSGEPLVQSVLAAFPGAEIIAVRPLEPAPEAAHGNDEVGFHDDLTMEDEL
ncbi:MAG: DNA polymerase III subunit gamma/tau, partial [Alphaproteobacteria bacterium]|nr:DNA polymerase III subunit gamma/tau [Alphaproteobacteria bacterium]